MKRLMIALATLAALVALAVSPASADPARFPDTIPLPDGFFPEGIAADGTTAYVGSLSDGSIQVLDLRSGSSTSFAGSPGPGKIAVGMDVDADGRLWVAGGGDAFFPGVSSGFRVYDTSTGALLTDVALPAAGFLNDVIVTDDAAWFTDTFISWLIRVPIGDGGTIGQPEFVTLGGDWAPGPGLNANGIVATADQGQLIVGQVTAPEGGTAAYYRVPADLGADILEATRIELDGAVVDGTDGLVLIGRTLYSVSGDGVTEIKLSKRLDRGRIIGTLEVPGALTPTTADVFGSRLYVVDAKFTTFGDPSTSYEITAIAR